MWDVSSEPKNVHHGQECAALHCMDAMTQPAIARGAPGGDRSRHGAATDVRSKMP
jgi:hypothetical protein